MSFLVHIGVIEVRESFGTSQAVGLKNEQGCLRYLGHDARGVEDSGSRQEVSSTDWRF